MLSKTFQTVFKIGAKYTGHPAFAAVNRDIDRTQRNAKMSAAMIGGLRTAYSGMMYAGGIAAAAAAGAIGAVGIKAFKAAKDVRKSQDIVRQANERLVAQGRLSSKDVEKRTQETIALAEAMEQAGGIDAEVLMEGFAELSKSMGSEKIKEMSAGLQDWLVTVHKGEPTNEQMIDSMQKINEAIFRGKLRGLMDLGLTKEQTKAIGKLTSAEERRAVIVQLLGKRTGAYATWLKTDAGATKRLERAQENWLERAGKPMADVSRNMTEALIELVHEMDSVADTIAAQMEPRLQNLVKWIVENKEEIAAFAKGAVNWLWWANDQFWAMSAASKAFFQPIVANTIKEWEALRAFWEPLWENTKKEWKEVVDYLSGIWGPLWANTLKEFETIKTTFGAIVKWFDTDFARPIYNTFIWLWDNLKGVWDKIIQKLNEVKTAHIGTSVPMTSGAYTGGGMAEDFKREESNIKATQQATPFQEPTLPEPGPIDPDALIPDTTQPTPAKSEAPYGGASLEPAGGSLKRMIRKMNMRERLSGAGGTNVANINPTINVHGVAPGREQLTAKAVAKAIRDPIRAGIEDLKKMQNYESRLGYV